MANVTRSPKRSYSRTTKGAGMTEKSTHETTLRATLHLFHLFLKLTFVWARIGVASVSEKYSTYKDSFGVIIRTHYFRFLVAFLIWKKAFVKKSIVRQKNVISSVRIFRHNSKLVTEATLRRTRIFLKTFHRKRIVTVKKTIRNGVQLKLVVFRKVRMSVQQSRETLSLIRLKFYRVRFSLARRYDQMKTSFRIVPHAGDVLKTVVVVKGNATRSFFLKIMHEGQAMVRILFSPLRLIRAVYSKVTRFQIRIRIFSFKTISLVILLVLAYLGSVFYFSILEDMPSSTSFASFDPKLSTTIYDRKGNVLYHAYQDEDRTLITLKDLPKTVVDATIAIEDQNFYHHSGLSVRGIARAARQTLFEEDLQGGSTITQQLVKNVLLSPKRTFQRKIREAILALVIEKKYSKNEILEMYLNTISYGGTAHGIASAAEKYFGKNVKDLTLAESAYLAGLPASPSVYSAYGSKPERGKARQKDVLQRMVEDRYISPQEAESAYAQELVFRDQSRSMKAPHFVNYVLTELERKYGQQFVYQGGLEVYTSLDPDIQSELEKNVRTNVEKLARNNVTNGAALITNPQTGEVLAMVGSIDYWNVERDGNVNVTTALRQPGSSIKPLLYSLALDSGYTPTTKILDAPISYSVPGQKPYQPVNYDGSYHGVMTLTSALANSYNVPAVRLLNTIGVDAFITHAQKMGITTWNDRSRFGLSIALGAGEVKMTDMAVAYGAIANGGYRRELDPILKIYDGYGSELFSNTCVNFLDEPPSILTRKTFVSAKAAGDFDNWYHEQFKSESCPKTRVISDKTAYLMTQMLSNNAARTPAFGARSELNITAKSVAVKTGTTQKDRDNWAIGFTNDYVVVTWVGNNNNEIMKGIASGYHGSSTIWRNAWDYLIANKDVSSSFSKPSGMPDIQVYTGNPTPLPKEDGDDEKALSDDTGKKRLPRVTLTSDVIR